MTLPYAKAYELEPPLLSVEVQKRLELLVDRVLSSRRSVREAAMRLGSIRARSNSVS